MRLLAARGNVSPELMEEKKVRVLVNEYARVLGSAISPVLESSLIPPLMAERLKDDVFVFSGFKTYQALREAAALLLDDNGLLKPFHRFYNDITAVKEDYNRNWLKAEYIFAQASAEMAAKWNDFETDGDRYNLQYRTANDGKVRPGHKVLHNVTLPVNDPFWDEFFPPNGWRCRCTVVQVRKGKYPVSDSNTAIQQGREATSRTGRDGVNKDAIFRFNPGKQQVIFPPHHPYYEISRQEQEKVRAALQSVKEEYSVIPTDNGRIRIHNGHGKGERSENIRVASYFANKYAYEIDLLDNPAGVKSADSFNWTLGRKEEYKINQAASKNSIDRLIRDAKNQADHIVLWISSDISLEDLSAALRSRIRRSENIQTVTVVISGKDICLARADILSEDFKIRLADLE